MAYTQNVVRQHKLDTTNIIMELIKTYSQLFGYDKKLFL